VIDGEAVLLGVDGGQTSTAFTLAGTTMRSSSGLRYAGLGGYASEEALSKMIRNDLGPAYRSQADALKTKKSRKRRKNPSSLVKKLGDSD
jgi:hypothetical protein